MVDSNSRGKKVIPATIDIPIDLHNRLWRILPKGYPLRKALIDVIKVGIVAYELNFLEIVPDNLNIRKYQMKLIVDKKNIFVNKEVLKNETKEKV